MKHQEDFLDQVARITGLKFSPRRPPIDQRPVQLHEPIPILARSRILGIAKSF